ncbi:MAG TPA: FtsX-like permease family protein [Terriglobia bacterium]|nr:FtsX-like permease family protein [Terriglobia bacterium]
MNRDEIPPGTVYLLILKTLARGGDRHGYETANFIMELSSERRDVMRLVVGQGMVLALAGAAVGLLGALGRTRLMASLLYGVEPYGPATFLAVTIVLCLVALAASYVPARRATKIVPMVALRHD